MILKLIILIALLPLSAEARLFTEWVEFVGSDSTAQDRAYSFMLAGADQKDDYFYLTDLNGRLSKRWQKSGQAVWQTKLESESQSTWRLFEGHLYGADTKGNLYRVNADSGDVIWKSKVRGIVFGQAAVGQSHVFVSTSYGVLQAFDRQTGEWQWQQSDPEQTISGVWSYSGPQLQDDLVMVGFPSGVLQAFAQKDGSRIWSESFQASVVGASEALGLNSVLGVNSNKDFLVASSFNGNLKAWSWNGRRTPTKLWEKPISVHSQAIFTEIDGVAHILVPTRDSRVLAVDLTSGFIRWEYSSEGILATALSVQDGRVWVSATDGKIRILGLSSGDLVYEAKSVGSPVYQPVLIQDKNRALSLSSAGVLRKLKLF